MPLRNLQNYLTLKSCKALIKAVETVDLLQNSDKVMLDMFNSGVKIDLKIVQASLKKLIIENLEKEIAKNH